MSATPSAHTEDRQAPIALWRAAHAFLTTLFHLFGAPDELAARHTLTRKDHQHCAQWLRAAEALLRRLLFIEAALVAADRASSDALFSSAQNKTADLKVRAPRQRRLLGFDAEHPEAWRVSFRAFNSSPACGGGGSRLRRETEGEPDGCAPSCASPSVIALARADSSPQPKSHSDFGQLKRAGRKAAGGGGAVRFRSAWPLAERMEALLRVFNDPAPYAKRLAQRLRKTRALAQRLTASWQSFRDLVGHQLHDALTEPIACAAGVFGPDLS